MTRTRIRLDTMRDITAFVGAMSALPYVIKLEDDEGNCVNAKSMLGVMYSIEFKRIWCTCDHDITSKLLPFMAE